MPAQKPLRGRGMWWASQCSAWCQVQFSDWRGSRVCRHAGEVLSSAQLRQECAHMAGGQPNLAVRLRCGPGPRWPGARADAAGEHYKYQLVAGEAEWGQARQRQGQSRVDNRDHRRPGRQRPTAGQGFQQGCTRDKCGGVIRTGASHIGTKVRSRDMGTAHPQQVCSPNALQKIYSWPLRKGHRPPRTAGRRAQQQSHCTRSHSTNVSSLVP